ncbi:DUF4386 domain-containing protein [bacterium]|nr:DUF4386 domain-containing protein [bacterium]
MTLKTNSRITGVTFIFYIAAGIASMNLFGKAAGGSDIAARLAGIAGHTSELGLTIILNLLCNLSAIILAVTLYALTRDADREIALLGLACRVGEGLIGAANLPKTLGLLWLATTGSGLASMDAATTHTLGSMWLLSPGSYTISALFFAFGSTFFSYLFLRGRLIPIALAWLGVVASVLLVVMLLIQAGGFVKAGWWEWMPMLVFELVLAFWLIVKGVTVKGEENPSLK